MKTIELTRGKVAIVDNEDFEFVSQYSWHAVRRLHMWYAERGYLNENGELRTGSLHRLIMDAARGEVVDHKNGDGLDCRKRNLRKVTKRQNQQNIVHNNRSGKTSKYKGVYLHTQNKNWNARIRAGEIGLDGKAKMLHLGCFDREKQAALAYDEAARKYFGEYAWTNFGRTRPKLSEKYESVHPIQSILRVN